MGPNGSGKSNIVDAVRWILGERGAKHLRGESLGNLIFAGTPKRPASGLARVAMHLGKSELLLDGAEEVVLERRIDKSGNSDFFLNGAEIRLKDLAPLLARARLGTRGLTIINQGESDVFVKSSPEERRLMMEEILGLKEFRLKKSEAERKLEATKQNMEKVSAMLEEIAPHLRFLKKQKNRWEKRVEVERELETLANTHFGGEVGRIRMGLRAREKEIAPLEAARRAHEKNLEAFREKLRALESSKVSEQKGAGKGEYIDTLYKKRSEIEREIILIETRLELEKNAAQENGVHVEELIRYAERLRKELGAAERLDSLEELKGKLGEWLRALERIFTPKKEPAKEAGVRTEDLKRELAAIERGIQEAREKEEEFIRAQKNVTKEFGIFLDSMEKERDEAARIGRRLEEERLEKERLKMKLEEMERGWMSLGRTQEELEAAVKESPNGEGGGLNAERAMRALQGELAAIGEIDTELLKEANETEERYEFLNTEHTDLGRATEDLTRMIQELEKRIHAEFTEAFKKINEAFNSYFGLMFEGGKAKLRVEVPEGGREEHGGIEFEVNIPRKKIHNLDMLSGGERSLVSLAALFALIWVSPPPFLVLDEIDAALDDENARRFAELVGKFSEKTQFIIVTHNRITMEHADILYGVTMGDDGVSKILSLKLEEAEKVAKN